MYDVVSEPVICELKSLTLHVMLNLMSLLGPGIVEKKLLTQTQVIYISFLMLLCMETVCVMDTNCVGEGFCHIFVMPNPSVLNCNFQFNSYSASNDN